MIKNKDKTYLEINESSNKLEYEEESNAVLPENIIISNISSEMEKEQYIEASNNYNDIDDQKVKLINNDDIKLLLIDNENINNKNKHKKTKYSTNTLQKHIYIEDLFEKIGYGRYQIIAILIAFFCISLEGVHLTIMSSMIIPLKVYFDISSFGIEVTSGFIFIGVGIGSLLLYYLVNLFDRTIVIKFSIFIITAFQLATVFINDVIAFTICRFIIGICIGAIVPICTNVLCEYLPKKFRSYTMTTIWGSFGIGQSLVPLFMIIFMPNYEPQQTKNVLICLWVFTFIACIFVITCFSDSPRSLILSNREKEAFKILKNMSSSIKEELTENMFTYIVSYVKKGGNIEFEKTEIKSLFKKNIIKTTLLLTLIWIFESMLYYGPLLIYSPTLKNLEITSPKNIILSILVASLIGVIILSFVALFSESKGIGLRRLSIIGFVICTIISILIVIIPKFLIFWLAVFFLFMSSATNTITTYTSCYFPTKIRDMALGFFYSATRIGGFLSQFLFLWLFNIETLLPYYTIIFINFICVVCSYFLNQEPISGALDSGYYHIDTI